MLKNIFVLLFCFDLHFLMLQVKNIQYQFVQHQVCKMHLLVKRIDESMMADVFIVEDKKRFYTYIGKFDKNKKQI